jgi:hypothetical protein
MKILLAMIASAAIAALVTLPVRSAPKPAEHWHYGNCNLIARHCVIG